MIGIDIEVPMSEVLVGETLTNERREILSLVERKRKKGEHTNHYKVVGQI